VALSHDKRPPDQAGAEASHRAPIQRRRGLFELSAYPGLTLQLPGVWGFVSYKFQDGVYAATASSTMSRVREGSTLTPGLMVLAKVTERM
jgi:hypothetical protein